MRWKQVTDMADSTSFPLEQRCPPCSTSVTRAFPHSPSSSLMAPLPCTLWAASCLRPLLLLCPLPGMFFPQLSARFRASCPFCLPQSPSLWAAPGRTHAHTQPDTTHPGSVSPVFTTTDPVHMLFTYCVYRLYPATLTEILWWEKLCLVSSLMSLEEWGSTTMWGLNDDV